MSQLVAQLFQMRARMQKMMGAMQGKDSPDMDELMESIKAEEQVKGTSSAEPSSCFGTYICLLS